jgi:hypothetical protein
MSLLAYKILHIIGAFLLLAALGALTLRQADGGRPGGPPSKLASISHGIALLLILVSGFGMLARLGIMHDWRFPAWIWLKLIIWLLMGAALVAIRRLPRYAALLWWLFPLLGGLAAYLALFKPAF